MLTTLCVAFLLAQTYDPDQGFVKVKGNPLDLARAADRAIFTLANAEGAVQMRFNIPAGTGIARCLVRVRDATHARVDGEIIESATDHPQTEILLKNGPRFKRIVGKDRYRVKVKVHGKDVYREVEKLPPPVMETNVLLQWPIQFTAWIMRGAIDRVPHISNYVRAAQSDPANYSTWIEHRSVSANGKVFNSDRIIVERKGQALKQFGPARMSIGLDGIRHLPVTVFSDFTSPGKKKSKVEWFSNWRGPMHFADKEFISPQKAQ